MYACHRPGITVNSVVNHSISEKVWDTHQGLAQSIYFFSVTMQDDSQRFIGQLAGI